MRAWCDAEAARPAQGLRRPAASQKPLAPWAPWQGACVCPVASQPCRHILPLPRSRPSSAPVWIDCPQRNFLLDGFCGPRDSTDESCRRELVVFACCAKLHSRRPRIHLWALPFFCLLPLPSSLLSCRRLQESPHPCARLPHPPAPRHLADPACALTDPVPAIHVLARTSPGTRSPPEDALADFSPSPTLRILPFKFCCR